MLNNIFLIKLLSIALLIGASYQFDDKSINNVPCPGDQSECPGKIDSKIKNLK